MATARQRQANGAVTRSVAGIVTLATAVMVVIGLGALWLVRDATGQLQQAGEGRVATVTAELLADGIGARVSDLQRRMAAAAADDGVVDAVASGDTAAMGEVINRLEAVFPEAIRVALVPEGFDQANRNADPPLGYALLDMFRRAEEAGESVGPEAHRLGTEQAHVNLVQPVTRDGTVLGHVTVAVPPERFHMEASGTAPGRVSLLQEGDAVFARGEVQDRDAAAPVEASVPGVAWRVQVLPAAASRSSPLWDPWFLVIAGGMAVLMATAGWLAARGLARRQVPAAPAGAADVTEAPVAKGDDSVDTRPAVSRARPDGSQRPPTAGIQVEEVASEPRPGASGTNGAPGGAPTETKESSLNVDPSLFRAYDIRGIVGDGLTPESVTAIGRSIGSEAAARGCTQVVVGRDGRLSSPELADALMRGLQAAGRHVIDIGQVPTPVMYFATHHLGTGTGVALTGSHNPPEYNGMKVMIAGETLSGEAITGLYRRLQDGDLISGEGSVTRRDVVDDYVEAIAGDITLHRPLRVVVDAGNGVAGELGPRVLRAIGCEVEPLYCEIDGNFPNHHPDPSDPANLDAMIRLVRLREADLGLAFDGDGDRLGVVDSRGKIIWADRQMMAFAADVLTRNPGADIVFDVKCSSQLAQVITANAGVPVMWRTGHSLIKGKLKASGAPLAGEMSGHIFFNDRWPGFDDGIYAAARLLEILSMDARASAEFFGELPEAVSTPEIKVYLEEGEPPQVIERLVAAAAFPDARVTTIDGLRVDFADGWGLVRSSNTTPCLVLRFEGDNDEALERIKSRFRDLLLEARPGLELPF